MTTEQLLTQTEARRAARQLNETGELPELVAVAQRVPVDSWSGTERGWTVAYVPRPK